MVPKQRGPGQTGGFGGQFGNRGKSVSRGGRPSKGGCLKAAIPLGAIVIEGVRQLIS